MDSLVRFLLATLIVGALLCCGARADGAVTVCTVDRIAYPTLEKEAS